MPCLDFVTHPVPSLMDTTENKINEKQEEVTGEHKCDTCGKCFSRLDGLKRHIACVHEGQKKYKCHLCEKSFSRSDHLTHHITQIHKPEINIPYNPWAVGNLEEFLYYCCPECNEKNQSKELFLQHALGTYA